MFADPGFSSTNSCHLKYTIGPVSSGGNATAQAAILVNQANAPPIIYSTMSPAASSTMATSTDGSNTKTVAATTSTTPVPMSVISGASTVSPSSPLTIASSSTVTSSTMQSPPMGSMSNGPIPPSSPTISPPTPVPSTSSASNVPPPPPTTTSTSSPAGATQTSTQSSNVPTTSKDASESGSATVLCPLSNHQVISQGLASYEVECSEQVNEYGSVQVQDVSTYIASSFLEMFLREIQPRQTLSSNVLVSVIYSMWHSLSDVLA